MVDGVQVPFPDYNVFVLEGVIGRNPFGSKGLILDFEQLTHPCVREHGCRRPKVKVFMGVLDLHMNDGSVVF